MIVPYESNGDDCAAKKLLLLSPALRNLAGRLSVLTAIACRTVDRNLAAANGLLTAMKVCWITLSDFAAAETERNGGDVALTGFREQSPHTILHQLIDNFACDVARTCLEEFAGIDVRDLVLLSPVRPTSGWTPRSVTCGATDNITSAAPNTLGWFLELSCLVDCSAELAHLLSFVEVTCVARDELNNIAPEAGTFTIGVAPRTTIFQCQHRYPCFGCVALLFSKIGAASSEEDDAIPLDEDPRLWTIFPRHCSSPADSRTHFYMNKLIAYRNDVSAFSPLTASPCEDIEENNILPESDGAADEFFHEIRLRLLFWQETAGHHRDYLNLSDPRGDEQDKDPPNRDVRMELPLYFMFLRLGELVVSSSACSRQVEKLLRRSSVHIFPHCESSSLDAKKWISCLFRGTDSTGVARKVQHKVRCNPRVQTALLVDLTDSSIRGSLALSVKSGSSGPERMLSLSTSAWPVFHSFASRFTILFDLDRTLVDNSILSSDFARAQTVSYPHSNGLVVTENLFLRKGAAELLHQLACVWQVCCILATKSSRSRARAIMKHLVDPTAKIFGNRLYCLEDLASVSASKSSQAALQKFRVNGAGHSVIIVDDAPQAWVPEDWPSIVAVYPYALNHRDPDKYFFPDGVVGQQILYRVLRLSESLAGHQEPLTPIQPDHPSDSEQKVVVEESFPAGEICAGSDWAAHAEEVQVL
jgi:hypothetical protein